MVAWRVTFKRPAEKDAEYLKRVGLDGKARALLALVREDPYRRPPPCEKLVGNLAGMFSRRINIKHRLVYEVIPEAHEVVVIRMCSHYGD